MKRTLGDSYVIHDPCDNLYGDGKSISAHALVAKDKAQLIDSDIVIANVWKSSVGTSMEIIYADEVLARIVILIHPRNAGVEQDIINPWYTVHSDHIVETWVDATKLVQTLYPSRSSF